MPDWEEVATDAGDDSYARGGDQEAVALAAARAVAPLLIQQGRDEAAAEIEVYADMCRRTSEGVVDQMTDCANRSNQGTVETYRQAANIARAGQMYRNPNCTKCRDTRGGPEHHLTEHCTWNPPEGLFEDRDQCLGMIHVGWMGPYGIVPGGLDNEPAPHWRPVYMKRV